MNLVVTTSKQKSYLVNKATRHEGFRSLHTLLAEVEDALETARAVDSIGTSNGLKVQLILNVYYLFCVSRFTNNIACFWHFRFTKSSKQEYPQPLFRCGRHVMRLGVYFAK